MSTWQPIETAPKDGQAIDVWAVTKSGRHGYRLVGVKWHAEKADWFYTADSDEEFSIENPEEWLGRMPSVVTHWMPIPAGPVAS
jgi:hypothetical protein